MENEKRALILTQQSGFLRKESPPAIAGGDIAAELENINKQLAILQTTLAATTGSVNNGGPVEKPAGSGMDRKMLQTFREDLQMVIEEAYLFVGEAKETKKQRDKRQERTNGFVIVTCIVLLLVNAVIPFGLWALARF